MYQSHVISPCISEVSGNNIIIRKFLSDHINIYSMFFDTFTFFIQLFDPVSCTEEKYYLVFYQTISSFIHFYKQFYLFAFVRDYSIFRKKKINKLKMKRYKIYIFISCFLDV